MIKYVIPVLMLILGAAAPLQAEQRESVIKEKNFTLIMPAMQAPTQAVQEAQQFQPHENISKKLVQYGIQYTLNNQDAQRFWVLSAGVSDLSKRAVGVAIETTW